MTPELYRNITQCRACKGSRLPVVHGFPNALPAGLYTSTPVSARLPLTLLQCDDCGHVQLREMISEDIYAQYIYVTPPASALSDYLPGLAASLTQRFSLKHKRILEVGSSNGSFLRLFAADNDVLGIEPSVKLADMARTELGITTLQGYLGVIQPEGKFDLVLCRHVLEHINDLDGFSAAVIGLCKAGSLFLVEVPSLDRTIAQRNYSNIFHEHVNYFSRDLLHAYFAALGFRLVHEYDNDIHGGSFGLVLEYTGVPAIVAKSVPDAHQLFRDFDVYLNKVKGLLTAPRFIGYGAAHRTFTLLSMLDLADRIDYIVDQNPGYRGKYLGGTGIRIDDPECLNSEHGRDIIVFASSYEKEILGANTRVLERNDFISIGQAPRRISLSVQTAAEVRRHIVRMKHSSGSSHAGSALSIADILAVLYCRVLDVDPQRPQKPVRDRFVLSKGHASAALYATLAVRGFLPIQALEGFYRNGGSLPGHVDMTAAPGIEASSGSLGHGLSLGLGMALALRQDAPSKRVFVLCGNGEMDEGSVWEAIMYGARKQLDNLVLIVDHNRLQGYQPDGTDEPLQLSARIASFGWEAQLVDGHDHEALHQALQQRPGRPLALVAHTIKGKGVSYMENQFIWHYKSPNADQLEQALRELE